MQTGLVRPAASSLVLLLVVVVVGGVGGSASNHIIKLTTVSLLNVKLQHAEIAFAKNGQRVNVITQNGSN